MNHKKNNKGFTLAETLITVAILLVLAGLAFVGVIQYRKSLRQMEMESIAREIFIAAQNHLTMIDGQGFQGLGDDKFGTEAEDEKGRYYFVVNAGDAFDPSDPSLLDFILPVGAVDDTVRLGGNYIIYYQRSPALILDVFYSAEKDTFNAFDYKQSSDPFKDYRGLDKKRERRNYGSDRVEIGWHGGDLEVESGALLQAPTLAVDNGDKLTATIQNPNSGTDLKLQLIVRGETSGKIQAISITSTDPYILDDISTTGKHFAENSWVTAAGFIPGENLSLQAKVFSTSVFTNVAASKTVITNSLFDTGTTVDKTSGNTTAMISNIRHLENLSSAVSNCKTVAGATPFNLKKAVQTKDLVWTGSLFDTDGVFLYNGDTNKYDYRPINTQVALEYDGRYHSISGIVSTESSGNAGLFGELKNLSSVSNLRLIDFSVTGKYSGALAGSLTGSTSSEVPANVVNVIAYNSTGTEGRDSQFVGTVGGSPAQNISGSDSAGGLIGRMSAGVVDKSAAALIVRSSGGNAGGLIGTTSGGTINACYSGGHTIDKTAGSGTGQHEIGVCYSSQLYNVNGVNAGGLVGNSSGTTIQYSYSTCSVKGTSSGGGLIGIGSGGKTTDCYCTGLVDWSNYNSGSGGNKKFGAFAGQLSGSPKVSNCYYFEIINEIPPKDPNDTRTDTINETSQFQYLYAESNDPLHFPTAITPLDADTNLTNHTTFYNTFSGGNDVWHLAQPYNVTLAKYYKTDDGKTGYNLKTVDQLVGDDANYSAYYVGTHYGDWPAPEIFIIN